MAVAVGASGVWRGTGAGAGAEADGLGGVSVLWSGGGGAAAGRGSEPAAPQGVWGGRLMSIWGLGWPWNAVLVVGAVYLVDAWIWWLWWRGHRGGRVT